MGGMEIGIPSELELRSEGCVDATNTVLFKVFRVRLPAFAYIELPPTRRRGARRSSSDSRSLSPFYEPPGQVRAKYSSSLWCALPLGPQPATGLGWWFSTVSSITSSLYHLYLQPNSMCASCTGSLVAGTLPETQMISSHADVHASSLVSPLADTAC